MRHELIRSAADALIYYADCAIASYEMAQSKMSTSHRDRKRLRSIANGMVEQVRSYSDAPLELKELERRLAAAELVKP